MHKDSHERPEIQTFLLFSALSVGQKPVHSGQPLEGQLYKRLTFERFMQVPPPRDFLSCRGPLRCHRGAARWR